MPSGRPDFSNYVAHFTKDATLSSDNVSRTIVAETTGTALERLIKILNTRKIIATPMPWTNRLAVAYTECPWGSLLDHSKRYSPFGIGFSKGRIYAAGGGPAIYLRPDLWEKQQQEYRQNDDPQKKGFHPHLWAFVTPFVPEYAPKSVRDNHWRNKPVVDYSHEREWRVPHDFTFELTQVEFVVVETYEHMAQFPKELKDAIGRDRFLILDVYRDIERLWPIHVMAASD